MQQPKPADGFHKATLVLGKTTKPNTEITVSYELNVPELEVGQSPSPETLLGFNAALVSEGDRSLEILPIPITAPTKTWIRITKDPVTVKKPGGVSLMFYFAGAAGSVELRNINVTSKVKTGG